MNPTKAVSLFTIFLGISFWMSFTPFEKKISYSNNLENDTLYYIFLGHTYQYNTDGSKVDYRLEGMDFSKYDRIWLGGDICSETSLKKSTIQYLDDLFDLARPGNHVALGNHDIRNGNLEWFEEYTERPDYYTHFQDEITTVVLNTNWNPSDCEQLDRQYKMIEQVCDTITDSKFLIFLQHHNLWSKVPGLPKADSYSHAALPYWNTNCSSVDAYFENTIYELQKKVQKRGIKVINVMGDSGWGKIGSNKSDDGIYFLASGISETHKYPEKTYFKDRVLVFKHVPTKDELKWEFQLLDSLYEVHGK